jgi:hypothetical protein
MRSGSQNTVDPHSARVPGEGLRRAIYNRHRAALEKGGDAEQAPRPALAIKTMTHRNARRVSLAAEPQSAAGTTGEVFNHSE